MAPAVPNQRSLFPGEMRRPEPEFEGSRSEAIRSRQRQQLALPADRIAGPVPEVLTTTDGTANGFAAPSLWEETGPELRIVPEPLPKLRRLTKRSGPAHFPELPTEKYDIIYADPPWDYKGQLQHAGPGSKDTGGAVRHYPTVTSSELKQLDLQRIAARDCLLFMWATNPHLDQAIDLGKSWGFAWATVAFVWDKIRVNPGFYTLSQCELCLVFKRGKIPRPRGARNIRQMVQVKRGAHSTKPAEVRRRIDEMFPEQRKIELFARYLVEGWEAWGLDVSDGS